MKNFVHLHTHTHYSLLDGMIKVPDLIEKAIKFEMPAVSITDHGNIYGAMEFYSYAKEKGINPIIGCEIYISNGSHHIKKIRKGEKRYFHLVLLCQNKEGYDNLMKILYISYKEGFYYRPRIDRETLKEYSKGIIALSACLGGEIPYYLSQYDPEDQKVKSLIKEYQEIFPQRLYLEMQDHGIKEQKDLNKKLEFLGQRHSIPLLITNDVHYLNKEDADAHKVLISIASQSELKDVKNRKSLNFKEEEFYFKSYKEMLALFPNHQEALDNTLEIAKQCQINFDFSKNYPRYSLSSSSKSKLKNKMTDDKDSDFDSKIFFKDLCSEGFKKRYQNLSDELIKKAKQRLEREIKVIEDAGFVDYFLIVWDLVHYAKSHSIPVGPGRGSVVGSLVAYVLYITEIEPLTYNLIFERFLNPQRVSMPDIDLDFSDEKREELIQYLKKKYGENKVSNIITFGSLKARAVIRDVGRVLKIPLQEIDKIAKKIPNKPDITLKESIKQSSEFKKLSIQKEYQELFNFSKKLEGVYRHSSTHAAGIVIGSRDLFEIIPLSVDIKKRKDLVTQYEGKYLDYCQVLKLDLLGLKNLSIIDKTLSEIKKRKGHTININALSLDDKKTYKLLQEGKSKGIFQVESTGMQSLLKRFKPSQFEDIIALIALYRPGPLDSGMMEEYIKRKQKGSDYLKSNDLLVLFPSLEDCLKETYGIIVYQEQVMQISQKVAGFSMSEADSLRKIIGKKNPERMKILKEDFIQSVINHSKVKEEVAQELFRQIETFGRYGFNKSHSTAYALITYQTAYLKANYPREYIVSLLNGDILNQSKFLEYIKEAQSLGIKILGPCIQKGGAYFTLDSEGNIYYALFAIKNLSTQFVKDILKAREKSSFKDLRDFLKRISFKGNKKAFELLIKAGALDSFSPERSRLLAGADLLLKEAERTLKNKEQVSLFEEEEDTSYFEKLLQSIPKENLIHPLEILNYEKELLGLFLSKDPFSSFYNMIKSRNLKISSWEDIERDYFKYDSYFIYKLESFLEEIKIKAEKNFQLLESKKELPDILEIEKGFFLTLEEIKEKLQSLKKHIIPQLNTDKLSEIKRDISLLNEKYDILKQVTLNLKNLDDPLVKQENFQMLIKSIQEVFSQKTYFFNQVQMNVLLEMEGVPIYLWGFIKDYKISISKKGDPWAIVFLETPHYDCDLLLFSQVAKNFKQKTENIKSAHLEEKIIWVKGTLKSINPKVKIFVQDYQFPLREISQSQNHMKQKEIEKNFHQDEEKVEIFSKKPQSEVSNDLENLLEEEQEFFIGNNQKQDYNDEIKNIPEQIDSSKANIKSQNFLHIILDINSESPIKTIQEAHLILVKNIFSQDNKKNLEDFYILYEKNVNNLEIYKKELQIYPLKINSEVLFKIKDFDFIKSFSLRKV